MKELNIKELPNSHDGVVPTGEIGVAWVDGRWERNGQRALCPLSRLILQQQPYFTSWLQAAAWVTGWRMSRTLAFKLAMGKANVKIFKENASDAQKGITDAHLYGLLYELSRKTRRPKPD